MSFRSPELPPMPAAHEAAALAPAASVGHSERPEATPAAPVSNALAAVDAVMQAADRIATREQRSVQLDFAVGDSHLAVRVELHGEEIRTTFRTDSADLQEALAHEWETVTAQPVERPFRLAPATITGSGAEAGSSHAGDHHSGRQPDRELRPNSLPREFAPVPNRAGETVLATTPAQPRALSGAVHRLLSFA